MLLTSVFVFCAVEKKVQSQEAPAAVIEAKKEVMAATDPAESYAKYCASCHGSDARAFADRRTWVHGSDQASIASVIIKGLTNDGMPAFEETFSAKEVEELAA